MVKRSDNVRSVKTSSALDTEDFGLSQREETKRTQLIGQYLEEYFWDAKSITSGGRAECTALDTSSDSDVMGVIKGIVVVDNDYDMDENGIYISAVRTERFPGYCKLKFQADQYRKFLSGQYTPIKETIRYSGIRKSIVRSNDHYISSKLFCKNVIPCGLIRENFHDKPYEINGPATRNGNVDLVQAFEMRKWPREAKIWITRSRINEWPCKVLMKRLEEKISCYVVAIGNKASADFDMEWRLSFVEIERELIWNMNETQFKCFVILKRLKEKCFEKYPALKDITTYHIKNIMFWMCEASHNEWVPRNLMKCVKGCLQELKRFMIENTLDHYIIPENNLFRGKTFIFKEIQQALKKLQGTELHDLIDKICLTGNELQNLLLISPEANGYSNTCKCMWGYCDTYYAPEFYRNFIDKYPEEAEILLPCVKIAQAKVKWREELREMARRKEAFLSVVLTSRLPKSVVNEIKEGREMDFSTSRINAAIVYFMHGCYDEVLIELKPILSKSDWKIYPSCLGRPMYLCFETGEMHYEKKENVRNVKDLKSDRINLVNDFCTTHNDIFSIDKVYVYTLPYPLALQLCLASERDRRFRYNPVVICYYLMFMSQLKLGHSTALKDTKCYLKEAVRNNKGRKDYYMSLVLLGHCLYCSDDIESAFNCFAKSMEVKKSVHNVAVYHMAFLINDWRRYNK